MKVIAILFLVAGIAMFMFGSGSLDGRTAHQLAGAAFVLVGLGKLVHMMGMCPMCNVKGSKK